jgi:serine/threonine-protein kinase
VFVKLLDFGIAKGVELPRMDSGTKTGSMIGSPFYMSPEQILGSKNIDHRSDLWSVGVLAFEMLTGVKPFDAETMGGLAIRIHSEPLPVPSAANPALPVELDAWFARACARDMTARFDSAKEMIEELARALGGQLPRSFDPSSPRLSAASHIRRADPAVPTLAAGAATDAGVVRGSTQSRARSRFVVLLAIFVIVPPLAYVGFRAVARKDAPAGLAPEASVVGASVEARGTGVPAGSAAASAAAVASGMSVPGPAPAPVTPATVTPATVTPATVTPATTVVTPKAGGAPARPARPRHDVSVHAASPSPLPSPPVTSTPTPSPAPSGHDIF